MVSANMLTAKRFQTKQSRFQAKQSERVFALMSYNWILFPLFLLSTLWILYNPIYNLLNLTASGDAGIRWSGWSLLAILSAVTSRYIWFDFIGLCVPFNPRYLEGRPVVRRVDHLFIVLRTTGKYHKTVIKTVQDMQGCLDLDSRISFHVVTEPQNAHKFDVIAKDAHIEILPDDYRPKAFGCARPSEWFRTTKKLTANDWVLHLDEDTFIDRHCLKACLDFAERQDKADIGQGIIHANDQPFWTNPLVTVYDVSRVVENWGRLWTFYWTGNPIGGMHGSFAFVNGAVENAVTWETESIIEDYWFARTAHGRGYRFGFIPGIAREQSPSTIGDCLKQRQRWFAGVYQNGHIRPYLNQAGLIWAPVQYLLWTYWLLSGQRHSTPSWTINLALFNFAMCYCPAAIGCFLQDYDAGLGWLTICRNQVLTVVLKPICAQVDALAAFLTMLKPETRVYHVAPKAD